MRVLTLIVTHVIERQLRVRKLGEQRFHAANRRDAHDDAPGARLQADHVRLNVGSVEVAVRAVEATSVFGNHAHVILRAHQPPVRFAHDAEEARALEPRIAARDQVVDTGLCRHDDLRARLPRELQIIGRGPPLLAAMSHDGQFGIGSGSVRICLRKGCCSVD